MKKDATEGLFFVFAKVIGSGEKQRLILINNLLKMSVIDVASLQTCATLDLIEDSRIFDLGAKHLDPSTGLSLLQTQQDILKEKQSIIKEQLLKAVEKEQGMFSCCAE